jgi:alpha-L-fucosidase
MAVVSRKSKRDPNLRWFDEARFGMFIHFGLYALLGRGEWVMYEQNIPRREYERLLRRFNPRKFDADAWVDLAVESGARYVTVTAKHHDGFCLFDSALTDFKITNTPFGRDLIGELARACRRRGVRIVLYYSQPDWHHPNFVHRKGAFKDLQPPPADQRPDWPAYQKYLEGQVRELVTGYGRIDGIWFDGSHKSEREWRGRRLYRLIKRHQPHAVVNDRARCGDFFTPERSLPDDLTGYLFEACEAVQTWHWGYQRQADLHNVPHLIESLVRMAAAGGNYLLNVGPRPDGTIPAAQAARMRMIGRWLRRCGEAVYATQACKLETPGRDVLATRRGNDVYLHLLRWPPTSRLIVPGVRSLPDAVRLLGSKRAIHAEQTRRGLKLTGLPALPVEDSVNVIRLRFGAGPRLRLRRAERPCVPTVALRPKGATRLPAAAARTSGFGVKGCKLRLRTVEEGAAAGSACLTNWWALAQSASWRVRSPGRRRVRVAIELACPRPYAGSRFVLRCGRDKLTAAVRPTASFDDFRRQDVGVVTLPAGTSTIVLRPTCMPYAYLFADVRALRLTPLR